MLTSKLHIGFQPNPALQAIQAKMAGAKPAPPAFGPAAKSLPASLQGLERARQPLSTPPGNLPPQSIQTKMTLTQPAIRTAAFQPNPALQAIQAKMAQGANRIGGGVVSPGRQAVIQLMCATCGLANHETAGHLTYTKSLLPGPLEASAKHIKGSKGGNKKTTKASLAVMQHAQQALESGNATHTGNSNQGNDLAFSVPRAHKHRVKTTREFSVHKGGGNGATFGYYMVQGEPSDSEESDVD